VATGNVFWIGIVAVVAALTVLLPLREVPLPKRARASTDADEAGGEAANVALRPGLVETEPADG
jgi:hypothetical protein